MLHYRIKRKTEAPTEQLAIAAASRQLTMGDHSNGFLNSKIKEITVEEDNHNTYNVYFTVAISTKPETIEKFERQLTEFNPQTEFERLD